MPEQLPTFDDLDSNAFAVLGDAETSSGPTGVKEPDERQAEAERDARRAISQAKSA